MAVVKVRETWHGRDGEQTDTADRRTYRRIFRVYCNSKLDGPFVVQSSPDLPAIGDPYHAGNDLDEAALCRSRHIRQHENLSCAWIVECLYDTEIPNPALQAENPLDRPARVRRSPVRYEEALEKDVETDDAITNSADDPFQPPPTTPKGRPGLIITYNLGSYPDNYDDYCDVINSDSFTIRGKDYDPGTLLSKGFTSSEEFENGTAFVAITWEVEVKKDGWQLKLLDQGTRAWDPDAGRYYSITNNGQVVSQPVLLDGDGAPLAHGGTPVYLPYNRFLTLPFADLALSL